MKGVGRPLIAYYIRNRDRKTKIKGGGKTPSPPTEPHECLWSSSDSATSGAARRRGARGSGGALATATEAEPSDEGAGEIGEGTWARKDPKGARLSGTKATGSW